MQFAHRALHRALRPLGELIPTGQFCPFESATEFNIHNNHVSLLTRSNSYGCQVLKYGARPKITDGRQL